MNGSSYCCFVDDSQHSHDKLTDIFCDAGDWLWMKNLTWLASVRVWQIDFKWCTITHSKSASKVWSILSMNFTRTTLRNPQIIVDFCSVL